jgi:hypothetical protein
VPFGGDNIRDATISEDRLYLLISKGDSWMVAETADLETWTHYVLPGMLRAPRALEFDGESFYIGMVDGNLFRSVGARPIRSPEEAAGSAPRSFHGFAQTPVDGRWYWAAISEWQDWSLPARIYVDFHSQDSVNVRVDNVAGFLIFPPVAWIDPVEPVGIFVNDRPVFRGLIDSPSALTLAHRADGQWLVEPADVTRTTYRPVDRIVGFAETALTMQGEWPSASGWKAEVYRWTAGADIGFAHQWPPGLELLPGEIRLKDLFDQLEGDSVVTFRMTGAELRRMIAFNLRHREPRFRVGLAGVRAAFEVHEDAAENRVVEWSLSDDKEYLVAGDLRDPFNLNRFLGLERAPTPVGISAFQAAVRWLEAHHRVAEPPSQIRVIRKP